VGNSVIACHVVWGRSPQASVAASRNASQSLEAATQPAMMLASESNVASVCVELPFGYRRRNRVVSPVAMETRFRGIVAAFRNPGFAPPKEPSCANCASEKPAATVVSSLTMMGPDRRSPSAVASSTSSGTSWPPTSPPADVRYSTALSSTA